MISYENSAGQLLFGIFAILGMATGIVLWWRKQMRAPKIQSAAKFTNRNKYPEADVFRWRGTFLKVGLIFSIGLAVLALNWTTFAKKGNLQDISILLDDEIIVNTPRTPPPAKPIPPVPNRLEIKADLPDDTPAPEFVMPNLDDNSLPAPEPKAVQAPVVAAPPVIKIEEEPDLVIVAEEMPLFPGCEDGAYQERKICAERKLLEFIQQNIRYPAIARENNVEGTVVVRFVVEKDGAVSNISVVRDIGAQCGQEAARVVNLMNQQEKRWRPGKQNGRFVRVQFNLPVKFKLSQ